MLHICKSFINSFRGRILRAYSYPWRPIPQVKFYGSYEAYVWKNFKNYPGPFIGQLSAMD